MAAVKTPNTFSEKVLQSKVQHILALLSVLCFTSSHVIYFLSFWKQFYELNPSFSPFKMFCTGQFHK